MTSGSIPRHLLLFSLPMLAGNLMQTGYSLVNAIWVGNFLGKGALAALMVSFSVFFVLIPIGAGLTMATNILVSQYVGAREWPQMRRVVQTSTTLIFGISVVLMLIGEATAPWLLRVMQTPPTVLPEAIGYMRVMLLTLPAGFGFFLISSLLRGAGDSTTPLLFQAISIVITGVLDPLLMFGWLGCPRLGLNGTAVAALLAQVVALIALIVALEHKQHLVAPDWRRLSIDLETTKQTILIGLPSAIQQSLVSIGMVWVIRYVNVFGENATAAFGAVQRIDQFAFLPAMSIGMAVSTLAGQNIGAGRLHRVPPVFGWGIALVGGITLLVSLITVTIPGVLLRMFVNDAQVMTIGIHYLRLVGMTYVFFAVIFVCNGIINGAGYTFVTTIVSLVSLYLVRVPLAWYLTRTLHRVEGVWYAIAVSFAASMVISLAMYASGIWKRPIIRHRQRPPGGEEEPAAALEETLSST